MTDKVKRCAIYIRVSTSEQAMYGKSLQAQRECLEQYAEKHSMSIIGVYADEGQTARKELKKRKSIHLLLSDVKAGKIDVILFWKMDRWFRNVSDFYKVQDILDIYKVTWVAVAEPNMNMDTRDGRLSLNIMLSIGQNEVDTTSERIKFTVNNMIDNGRLVWGDNNIGFGYKIINGKMEKNPDTEYMANKFFEYILIHQNKSATVRYMQDTFGIPFSYSMLRTMMSSEFYVGRYRSNNDYCPAYLTQDQWEKVQNINKKNIRHTASGRVYYFSGLIRCPNCGVLLCGTGSASIINRKTGEKRTYCYYRCNNTFINHSCSYRTRLSQNLIEQYLLHNLRHEFLEFKTGLYKASATNVVKPKRTKSTVRTELDRLNLLFQKGRIDFNYYESEYTRLEDELKELETIIPIVKDYSHIEALLASDFISMYVKLSEEHKQNFWQGIIESIELDGKDVKNVHFI